MLDLDTGNRTVAIRGASTARYVSTGHLVFAREDALWAVAFDGDTLEVSGQPVRVLDGVAISRWGGMNLETTDDGSLVYVAGESFSGDESRLVWVDLEGRVEDTGVEPGDYGSVRLSPDGSRLAVWQTTPGAPDVLVGGISEPRLRPFAGQTPCGLIWTTDGRQLIGNRPAGLVLQASDGSGDIERLTDGLDTPTSFGRAGQMLAFHRSNTSSGMDLAVFEWTDRDRSHSWCRKPDGYSKSCCRATRASLDRSETRHTSRQAPNGADLRRTCAGRWQ